MKMGDYMLVYHSDELLPIRYTNSNFQFDKDSHRSTSNFLFSIGGAIC